MLIGGAFNLQTARRGTLSNACPVDMRGDVGVADLFKWRTEKTMLRPHLERSRRSVRCVKFVTRITVVDYDDVTARQLARNILNPIERVEIHFGLIRGRASGQFSQMISKLSIVNRLMEECEFVAIQADKFFQPIG